MFAASGLAAQYPRADTGLLIALGKCFSVIAYAQLVAENCRAIGVAPGVVSVMFHGLIEDLSAEVLRLSAMLPTETARRSLLKRAVRVPDTTDADLEAVFQFIDARHGP